MFIKTSNSFLTDNILESLFIVKKYFYNNFGGNVESPV